MKVKRDLILLLLVLVLLAVASPSPMHQTSSEVEIVEKRPPRPIPGSTSEIAQEDPIPTLSEPQVPGHFPPPEDLTTLIWLRPKDASLSSVKPAEVEMEERPWRAKLKTFKLKSEPPSLNYEMGGLLKKRRHVLLYTFELRALTEYLPKVDGVEVVKLVGGQMDQDVMSVMTNRGRSFFVIGGNGKVWFFESKLGGALFTWTDKINPILLEVIRNLHDLPSTDHPLIEEAEAAGEAAAPPDRSLGPEMAAGSKGFFQRLSSALKSFRPT